MEVDPSFIPRFPTGISIRMPTEEETLTEVAATPNSWYVFASFFKAGWYLPLPRALAEFLILAKIAPCQLTPTAYRTLLATINLFVAHDRTLSGATLAGLYKMLSFSPGKPSLRPRSLPALITFLPKSDKGWNLKPVVLTCNIWDLPEGSELPPTTHGKDFTILEGIYKGGFSKANLQTLQNLMRLEDEEHRWNKWIEYLPSEKNVNIRKALSRFFSLNARNYYDPKVPGKLKFADDPAERDPSHLPPRDAEGSSRPASAPHSPRAQKRKRGESSPHKGRRKKVVTREQRRLLSYCSSDNDETPIGQLLRVSNKASRPSPLSQPATSVSASEHSLSKDTAAISLSSKHTTTTAQVSQPSSQKELSSITLPFPPPISSTSTNPQDHDQPASDKEVSPFIDMAANEGTADSSKPAANESVHTGKIVPGGSTFEGTVPEGPDSAAEKSTP